MDNEYNFDLNSEEKLEPEQVKGGLEKLKLSGLEDKYAENRLFNKNDEKEQTLRSGLSDIQLENNDFEDPGVIWSHPPDLDQKLRLGLTGISMEQTDFHPSLPKHLATLEETLGTTRHEAEAALEQISEMDNNLLQTGREETSHSVSYTHLRANETDT